MVTLVGFWRYFMKPADGFVLALVTIVTAAIDAFSDRVDLSLTNYLVIVGAAMLMQTVYFIIEVLRANGQSVATPLEVVSTPSE